MEEVSWLLKDTNGQVRLPKKITVTRHAQEHIGLLTGTETSLLIETTAYIKLLKETSLACMYPGTEEPRIVILMEAVTNILATLKSGRRAREEISENADVKCPPLKYSYRTSIMTVTEQPAYCACLWIRAENNVMHPAICLLDTLSQPNFISRLFCPLNGYRRYLKMCNSLFYLCQSNYSKRRETLQYITELAIFSWIFFLPP